MHYISSFYYFRPGYGFRAEDNKSTTNVAWLVGAAGGVAQDSAPRHIDIVDTVAPSPLAVAPLAMNPRMGYSLSRSKTVSDIPFYGDKGGGSEASDSNPVTRHTRQQSPVKRTQSSVSVTPVSSVADMSTLSTQATVSTQGSVRSKVVRHKTLLGSSSRLYKFSQSLSSLTTITSDSRAASSTTSTLRSGFKLLLGHNLMVCKDQSSPET